jgi:iron complex transport system substrate-binding protein
VTDIEDIAKIAVDCGFQLHKQIGPGLLETVYELLLEANLKERGLIVARQVPISIKYNDIAIDNAFRADIIVNDCLIIELKSTENHSPVHGKQLLTYLRLMKLPLGILMNFGMYSFRDGVKRVANNYYASNAQ